MTKKQKTKAILLAFIAVIGVAFLFNYLETTSYNTPEEQEAVVIVADKPLTPEEMIDTVLEEITERSKDHLKAVREYQDYVTFMQREIAKMKAISDDYFDVASTTNERLNKSTEAYETLRSALNF